MEGNEPIFVIGMPRSGTTLLSFMLDSHSRIAIPYESNFLFGHYTKRESFGDLSDYRNRASLVESVLSEPYVREWDYKISPQQIDLEKCDSLTNAVDQIYTAYAAHFGKDIWGDKSPQNTRHVDVLDKLFPASRFIHIIRDGRDVALSLTGNKIWWSANDFVSQLRTWQKGVRSARRMLNALPKSRFLEIMFADLVSEPEHEMVRVTSFLGIAYEPGMLSDYTTRAGDKVGVRINDIHTHLREPPSKAQAQKWKKTLSAADQAVAFETAGSLLEELGYPSGVKSHPLKGLRKSYHQLVGLKRRSYRVLYTLVFRRKPPRRAFVSRP